MEEMKGRRVVVTGGSSGIGLETARQLVKSGAEVCLVARREDTLGQAVESLGKSSWYYACDVSHHEQVAGLAGAVKARWGGLDGLVNNAGTAPMATLDDTDVDLWDHAFSVNVRGPYLLCRAFSSLLKAGSAPAVVNVSSTLAEKAIPGMAAYNSSKAALNQLTRSVALEWAPDIRVNAVMPAVVDTPIHERRGMSLAQVKGMGRIHPMRRIGQPSDVAALIVYLLSDRASWMTGTVIPVDGGMMAG
jgi:NAD(P)-dependent dehydrogenase (short-subunit alcohol dehydrogenase family)